jgi:phosphoribosylformylglycinamidine synthase II
MSDVAAPHYRELGLTDYEYGLILEGLGREPREVELAMLSLMWSEHCGYKHSKKLLKRLPSKGAHVLLGPGDNSGVVDVGDDLAVAFKVESHNHPSAVEPFQGAATGVGGILRDIFAVGARPIASLDSLRFGEVGSSAHSRYLLEQSVAGIGHYGNSIGVPTVGGEIYFEPSYEHNCLINAMAVGLARHERLTSSAAAGVGNDVVLIGARTGRDGIGGASVLASAEFGEDDANKRPTVQIGDPFAEKKVMECCLELLDHKLIVALQDCGAAGLTSATSEMISKGGVGLDLQLDAVPLRENDMEPFEVMVSESQERMVCIVEPRLLDQVLAVCERWEAPACVIGKITDTGDYRILRDEELIGEIPVPLLVDGCPVYDLAPEPPSAPLYRGEPARLAADASPAETLQTLIASANIASRLPVYEQYDPVVQSRTVRRPGQADAAVLALPVLDADSGAAGKAIPGIAITMDGNGLRAAVDPRLGATEAVYEGVANLICAGAEPLGLTNCLNYGNPEKPNMAWQLSEGIEGMRQGCIDLDVPVVSGNVSLYNESPDGPILPTPVVGIVGRLPDVRHVGASSFAAAGAGAQIALVGELHPVRAGSQVAKLQGEAPVGELPAKDLQTVRASFALVRNGVRDGVFASAHDIAEGGIAVALAELCIGDVAAGAGLIGARVELPAGLDPFGEDLGAAFLAAGDGDAIAALAATAKAPLQVIGEVGGERLLIEGLLELDVAGLAAANADGLARLLR